MSKRQTQSVSPLTRKRDCSTVTPQPAALICVMPESEGPNLPSRKFTTGTAASNEDQSLINLLKTIVENQQKQSPLVSPFAWNQGPAIYGPQCQCQMHSNECQNQMQNPPSEHLKVDSPTINEESSIKSLLITMLKNQSQLPSACSWNQGPSYFRQPSLPPCQMHANHCQHQHQMQNQSYGCASTPIPSPTPTANVNNEEPSTRSLLMTVLKNQTKMAAQLQSLIQAQEQVIKKFESLPVETLQSMSTRPTFKKIDSVKDCHDFEENLKNFEFTQNMIKHFESVCGGNSDLYGDNVAYALIDHIFTRRLFTLVTWTGLSRGTESKESFLKFERIFQFFFDLIRRVDSEYSIKSLKDFFQKIISNSKRRFEHKRSRISRVKLSSGMVAKRKKISLSDKDTNYERRNSNVDGEQEIISDEITDNDDDFKDNTSMYSNECNTDELTTNPDLNCIKAEDEED